MSVNFISSVTLPNEDSYTLKSLASAFINGTGTAAITGTNVETHAKWEATITGVTEYYDGLTLAYKVPVAGNEDFGTGLRINTLDYHPVIYGADTPVGTLFVANQIALLVYSSTTTGTLYTTGTATTVTGAWIVINGVNTVTYPSAEEGSF